MKVRIDVTVDVDAEAWAYEFGLSRSDVRADVREYFRLLVQGQLAELQLGSQDGRTS